MIFKKDHSFESRRANGTIYNGGKYSIIDSNTLVTVHNREQAASLYNFTIKNDTLHLKGNYISSNFEAEDQKVDFEPIDELWVRTPEPKNLGIEFTEVPTLDAALQQAAKEGKMIFMDCYTQWCGPCRYLASSIFPLKIVGDFFNANFINVSFDMETPEGLLIKKRYNIRAYPTLLFLSSTGEIQHMTIGAGDETALLSVAKTALDSKSNFHAMKEKIAHGDRSAKTISEYLSINDYASDRDKLLKEYFKSKSAKQRLSEDSWKLYNSFDNAIEGEQFQFFVKHRPEYEKRYGEKEVKNKMRQLMLGNINDSLKYHSLEKADPALFAETKALVAYREAFYWSRSDKKNPTLWKKLIDATTTYFALEGTGIQYYEYNSLCNFIYENYKTFGDKAALTKAKEWAGKAHRLYSEDMQINDTYAHILFELGFATEAIQHEEIALRKAREAKNSSAEKRYTNEILRFKKTTE
jgi:thiol-disulfide isomerase/thioredoxin